MLSEIYKILLESKATVATAESCTGGLVAAALTELGGASAIYRGGIVAYQMDLKEKFLNVPRDLLDASDAVHPDVAKTMAEQVRKNFNATFGVSTTGFAGPGGGTKTDPVGTVYIGIADPKKSEAYRFSFSGPRDEVRKASVDAVIRLLKDVVSSSST